jgi:hypothetical protein
MLIDRNPGITKFKKASVDSVASVHFHAQALLQRGLKISAPEVDLLRIVSKRVRAAGIVRRAQLDERFSLL